MQTGQANWEDSETNRIVDLSVEYSACEDSIEVHEITPVRVTFLCPESRQPLRSIRVHGEMARSILVRQMRAHGYVEHLEVELLQRQAALA